jgi:steroid 5-alpha reductase family enzyme
MSLNPLTLVLVGWIAAALLMTLLWLVQRVQRNAAIADVGWCFALGLVAIWYALMVYGDQDRRLLVAVMGGTYAFRLGLYIFLNRVLGKVEDERYQRMRREWRDQAQVYFFSYFQLQAVAVTVFSLPFLVLMQNPRPTFSLWELAGVLLWLIAVVGESVADWQLATFRTKPWNRDRVCCDGLWRYSRHPNYFFEWLHWWAYVLMGVGVSNGWLTLIGPVLMGWGLLRVTGIPLAEAQALATRGEEYRAYQRTTSSFIPWFPKRGV